MKQPDNTDTRKPRKLKPGTKLRAGNKVRKIPATTIDETTPHPKPDWIRIRLPAGEAAGRVNKVKKLLRSHQLSTVCEEASCPNLGECFAGGTATFMIMGDICTRRCSFCDVAHGIPNPLNKHEPDNLAAAVASLDLNYVVITSVDRDDLEDGGATHFIKCIEKIRELTPGITIEVLVPDFRTCQEVAVDILVQAPPDVFNHNLETVPRLYREVRPGANYRQSLDLLKAFTSRSPETPGKSGLMLGLGEDKDEVISVLEDLRENGVRMLTLGQYLQPTRAHLAVQRYIHPDEFLEYRSIAEDLGFSHVASGPMVRSSYHADLQASGFEVK
jgi:lipoic acid synthetase